MSEYTPDIRKAALEAYEQSPLRRTDERKYILKIIALQAILHDLGIDRKVGGPVVEVDGLTLTAHDPDPDAEIRPFDLPQPDDQDAYQWAEVRAHDHCPLCGEMRHSCVLKEKRVPSSESTPYPTVGFAAPTTRITAVQQLGQWLLEPHQCEDSSGRLFKKGAHGTAR